MKEAYSIKSQSSIHFVRMTIVDWVDVFSRKTLKRILKVADFEEPRVNLDWRDNVADFK